MEWIYNLIPQNNGYWGILIYTIGKTDCEIRKNPVGILAGEKRGYENLNMKKRDKT